MYSSDTILIHASDLDAPKILDDGAVIQQGKKLHTLNLTARDVFLTFDGEATVDDVTMGFLEQHPEVDNIQGIVGDFTRKLFQAGLLVEA